MAGAGVKFLSFLARDRVLPAPEFPALEFVRRDDEAVVSAFAGNTLANIGIGMNESAMVECFIPTAGVFTALEALCRVDEAGLRANAVKTLANIGMGMNQSYMVKCFIPIMKRLAVNNLASARVSACELLFVPYQTSSASSKVEHRSAYAALCRDADPLVRREAAANLWRFAKVDDGVFENDVMSLLEHLAQDADESVRSAAIQCCGALRDLTGPLVFIHHIVPLILAGCEDTSPRVREMVSNQLHHFCEVEVDIEDSLPLQQVKDGFAIPIPTLNGVLGVIAVGAFVYGTYHGVSSLKQLVKSIDTNGKQFVEIWTAKGCPPLMKIHLFPDVVFWKQT